MEENDIAYLLKLTWNIEGDYEGLRCLNGCYTMEKIRVLKNTSRDLDLGI